MIHPSTFNPNEIELQLQIAAKKIAPVWPLENFVAVNPYLALIDQPFNDVASLLVQIAGTEMTMPISYYLEQHCAGKLTEEDWQLALKRSNKSISLPITDFLTKIEDEEKNLDLQKEVLPTVISDVSKLSKYDWERFVSNRLSMYASTFFDDGQAIWEQSKSNGLFMTWKKEAEIDRSYSIASSDLKRFRAEIQQMPDKAETAAQFAINALGISEENLEHYLHRLLHLLPGWSAYAARIDWETGLLNKEKDSVLTELLAVLLSYEYAFFKCYENKGLQDIWKKSRTKLSKETLLPSLTEHIESKVLLQSSLEIARQRKVIAQFEKVAQDDLISKEKQRPKVQAVFCIDVRSEVFRRQFESIDNRVETIGFAGFFAFPIDFMPIGHKKSVAQYPVLLTPAATVSETTENLAHVAKQRGVKRHIKNAWYSFKMGAISCFSFVGPIGLIYLPKLFSDGFGLTRTVEKSSTESLPKKIKSQKRPDISSINLSLKVDLASGALNAMSLTEGFAPLVMITGHGSSTVNNPHATGLDCGACGGRTGEVNARIAAHILNEKEVRQELKKIGIDISEDTFFLSCQHDTTTDEISFFNADELPESHLSKFDKIVKICKESSKRTRAERSLRMGNDSHSKILHRSKDWSQVRPEWGLAGCANFIVAARERTQKIDLAGSAFLHSYAWKQDKEFGVLELIMTAPMIVASWISYQYYASTVDNKLYGAGNKTLHNVVGTVGVLEGNTGDLRTGLPKQSIHDGEKLQHDPLRLNVFIEAPIEEINKIIVKHKMVRDLFDNGWLYLFVLDEAGKVSHRYNSGLNWENI